MAADIDASRRVFLLRMLATGLFALPPSAYAAQQEEVPGKLPAGKSIYRLKGRLRINGEAATTESLIGSNDTLTTGPDSQAIFVVGKDAFLLHQNSELQLSGDDNFLVSGLRLVTGSLLSVFGRSRHQIETPLAIIGIRGTGLFVRSLPTMTYVCTCYGTTTITAAADPDATETIHTTHHDAPRYVADDGKFYVAAVIDHTDEELTLIEALVGRRPPFSDSGEPGGAKGYYGA